MGYSALPRHFQFAVLARAVLLAVLVVILLWLLHTTQLYATALVVILCAALVVADLVRVGGARRSLDAAVPGIAIRRCAGGPGAGALHCRSTARGI